MSDDSDPIEVVPYDQRWMEFFAVAERELRVALAPFVLEIEHIGSTAIPGLAAKPVVDIQVGVRTLDDSLEIVSAVESLGYEYVPEFEDELPDRRYFRRWTDGRRSHQVHLVERSNTEWWDRHARFRDWLRLHDDDRNRYAELKQDLAAAYRNNRRAYRDAKSDFIRTIEEKWIPWNNKGTGHQALGDTAEDLGEFLRIARTVLPAAPGIVPDVPISRQTSSQVPALRSDRHRCVQDA